MGITITANFKGAPSYDGGYGTFYRLRNKFAKAIFNDELFKIYEEWLKTDEDTPNELLDEICKSLYSENPTLYNFITQSDGGGKLTPKECKELYLLIKDSQEDFSFCYDAYHKSEMKDDIKKLLYDCWKHHSNLVWF